MNKTTQQQKPIKIRIHYREKKSDPWTIAIRDVHQIPRVGEFLAPEPINVFCVVLTLHVLFDADYDAELFAEVVDFSDVQHKTLGEEVWHG